MKRIAIFASGSGTNAENIMNYFSGSNAVEISLIVSNKNDAYVLERAKKFNVPSVVFSNKQMQNETELLNLLLEKADFIILAGFLLKVPVHIIAAFPNKIINIHPALLPKFGGKGMYGMFVHEAVKLNNESETGITIHFVNENYDEGAIIFQATTSVVSDDTPASIAQKVHELEYEYFPRIIEEVLNNA